MAHTESSSNSSSDVDSVFYCPENPNFTWDLNVTTFTWILVVIRGITSPCAILANTLVIIALNTKKVLKKQSTILLSSLAVTDLLIGVNLPLSTSIDVLILRQVPFANICILDSLYICFGDFLGLCSVYHLTVIAWERYIAIRKWMDYKVIVTISRVKKLAIAGWLAAIFIAAPVPVLRSTGVDHNVTEIWYIGISVLGGVSLIVIVYLYIMVYLGVREQRKINGINQVNALIKAKLQSKIAKTTYLLTAVVIASYVPLGFVSVLGETFPVLRTNMALRLVETFAQLNSIFNPVLYCYRNRRFRTSVLELLRMKKPQTIQSAVGAKRSVRKKSSRGSLEDVLETRKAEQRRPLFRSESCDPALAVDYHRNNEMMLTRTSSAPTLPMYNNSLGNQLLEPRQQDSTLFTPATTAHVERGGRYEARQSSPDVPNDGQTGIQGRPHLARIVSRSKSWDAGESVEFADRYCPRLQHSTVRRSESEPWISTDAIFLTRTHQRNLDSRQDFEYCCSIMTYYGLNSRSKCDYKVSDPEKKICVL